MIKFAGDALIVLWVDAPKSVLTCVAASSSTMGSPYTSRARMTSVLSPVQSAPGIGRASARWSYKTCFITRR